MVAVVAMIIMVMMTMMISMMMMVMMMIALTDPAGLLGIENKRLPPKISPSALLPRCVRQTKIKRKQDKQIER